MEPDELRTAWQALAHHLERQQALDLQRLREAAGRRLHDRLAPLRRGQWLQLALGAGVGLVLLGIACWQRNLGTPSYLAAGIVLHAFGVLTAALAGIALGRLRELDYAGPVLEIEQRLGRLRRFQALNGMLAGWPWWVMWVVLLVALAGAGHGAVALGQPGHRAARLAGHGGAVPVGAELAAAGTGTARRGCDHRLPPAPGAGGGRGAAPVRAGLIHGER